MNLMPTTVRNSTMPTGRTSKKSRQRELLILELLKNPKIEKAAARAGISQTTAWRIMKTPEFEDEYRLASKERYSQSMKQLQESAPAAVAILEEIMKDRTAPAPSRVRAATVALTFAAKSIDLEDIEARLSQLEDAQKKKR